MKLPIRSLTHVAHQLWFCRKLGYFFSKHPLPLGMPPPRCGGNSWGWSSHVFRELYPVKIGNLTMRQLLATCVSKLNSLTLNLWQQSFPKRRSQLFWYIPVSWNKLTQDWFKYTYFILFLVVISKTNFFFSLQTLLGDVQTLGHFFKKNSGCWRVPPHRFASWETSRGWGSSVFTITQQVEGLERGKVFVGGLE